jgi:hypothetical protein
MRILIYTLGLTAAASLAAANPPTTHPAAQTHGNPHTTTGKPTTSPSSGKTTKTTGTTSTTSGTTTTSGGTTSGGTTTTTTTPTLNPIAAKISTNHGLSGKVSTMLSSVTDPKTGKPITLDTASMGFKNSGQFIAALHVSQNLGIPFLDLKKAMVTSQTTAGVTTMSQTGSLGQAIQTVKGTSNTTAVTTATKQADDDIKTTTTTTSSTSTKKHGK